MQKIIEVILNQAPDVLAQQLVIERIDCISWFIFCVIGIVVSVKAGRWCWKKGDEDGFVVAGFMALAAFAFSFGLISNPVNFAETYLAPKAVAVNLMISKFGGK